MYTMPQIRQFCAILKLFLLLIVCLFGYFGLAEASSKSSSRDCRLPPKNVSIVESCHTALRVHCTSYPSPPRNLMWSFSFKNASESLHLSISWDQPEYGENTLWGYEVLLSYLHHKQHCYRINGKEDIHRNFTFKNLHFGRQYLVMVMTIPKSKRSMDNSIEKVIYSPDMCTFLKDGHLDLPLSCKKTYDVKLKENCNYHGTASLTWKVPKANHDNIFGELHSSCSSHALSHIQDFILERNATQMVFHNLKTECKYFSQLFMIRKYKGDWIFSKPNNITFSCETKHHSVSNSTSQIMSLGSKESLSVHYKVLYSLLGVLAFAIGIAILVIQIRRNLRVKECFKEIKESPLITKNNNGRTEKKEVPSVMLLHNGGCEYLHKLLLIFACILNANGLEARLDLLETLRLEEMGSATYYEKAESESDFVVIFCTNVAVPDRPQTKGFNFILEMIKQNIMDGRDRSKYIPVYFEGQSDVPGTLRCMCKKLPDSLTFILQKLHKIEPYVLSNEGSLPVRNSISLAEESTRVLHICIENLLKNSHTSCYSSSCRKGIASSPCTTDLANSFEDLVQ